MAKPGRNTKLTPALHKKLIRLVRQGQYIETAAAVCGVRKQTIYNWLNRANKELERVNQDSRRSVVKDEQPFVDFLFAYEEADALWEKESTSLIDRMGKGIEVKKTKTVELLDVEGNVYQKATTITTETKFDWTALAWRLERKKHEKYGRKQPIAQNDEQVSKVIVEIHDGFSDDEG